MSTHRSADPIELELVRIVRRIQTLTAEREELRRQAGRDAEFRATEGALEQLRWLLAAVARRSATDDLGNAA